MAQDRRLAAAAPGEVIEGRAVTLGLARVLAFSGGNLDEPGWPHRNLHTDAEKARDAGLPAIIASGTQTEGLLLGLMVGLFGRAWHSTGRIEAKFTRPVRVGETIQPMARLVSRTAEAGGERILLDIWCRNQDGTEVMVGQASGLFLPAGARQP
ncbi:MAG: MaoC family dehydratase [Alphaproteobacteria bacterium]|nr:MaoC family dehydratase [Alphaproteobacteria bacterium]